VLVIVGSCDDLHLRTIPIDTRRSDADHKKTPTGRRRVGVFGRQIKSVSEGMHTFCRRVCFARKSSTSNAANGWASSSWRSPLSRWLLIALALALAVAIGLFLFFSHYTRRETVTGQLVPSAGLLNIAAPSVGTVTRGHLHDGQSYR